MEKPEPKSIQAFQEDNRQVMLENDKRLARTPFKDQIAEVRRNNSAASIYNPTPKRAVLTRP
jgi:hypothetical protein